MTRQFSRASLVCKKCYVSGRKTEECFSVLHSCAFFLCVSWVCARVATLHILSLVPWDIAEICPEPMQSDSWENDSIRTGVVQPPCFIASMWSGLERLITAGSKMRSVEAWCQVWLNHIRKKAKLSLMGLEYIHTEYLEGQSVFQTTVTAHMILILPYSFSLSRLQHLARFWLVKKMVCIEDTCSVFFIYSHNDVIFLHNL